MPPRYGYAGLYGHNPPQMNYNVYPSLANGKKRQRPLPLVPLGHNPSYRHKTMDHPLGKRHWPRGHIGHMGSDVRGIGLEGISDIWGSDVRGIGLGILDVT